MLKPSLAKNFNLTKPGAEPSHPGSWRVWLKHELSSSGSTLSAFRPNQSVVIDYSNLARSWEARAPLKPVFTPVKPGSPCKLLRQGGSPWKQGCTGDSQTKTTRTSSAGQTPLCTMREIHLVSAYPRQSTNIQTFLESGHQLHYASKSLPSFEPIKILLSFCPYSLKSSFLHSTSLLRCVGDIGETDLDTLRPLRNKQMQVCRFTIYFLCFPLGCFFLI